MIAAVVVGALLYVGAHNNSDGTSRFAIGQDGTIEVTLGLLAVDAPELCGFELAPNTVASPALDRCVQRLPSWLRIRRDDDACTIDTVHWSTSDLELTINGVAHCDRPAGHTIIVDWGLFAGQDLEHVNTATFVLPDASQQRVLFSRRHRKATIAIDDPRATRAAVAAVCAVLGATATGIAVLVGRRRRRRHSEQ